MPGRQAGRAPARFSESTGHAKAAFDAARPAWLHGVAPHPEARSTIPSDDPGRCGHSVMP